MIVKREKVTSQSRPSTVSLVIYCLFILIGILLVSSLVLSYEVNHGTQNLAWPLLIPSIILLVVGIVDIKSWKSLRQLRTVWQQLTYLLIGLMVIICVAFLIFLLFVASNIKTF